METLVVFHIEVYCNIVMEVHTLLAGYHLLVSVLCEYSDHLMRLKLRSRSYHVRSGPRY